MTLPDPPKQPEATPLPLSAELIDAHQASVWRFLRFLGASPSLADDLCQEAFLAWHQDPPRLRRPDAAGAWLRRTAQLRFFRQRREPLRRDLSEIPEAELEPCWQRLTGADQGQHYRDALELCLQTLRPIDRQLIEARYGEGIARAHLAAAHDMSLEGLKSRLRRLREGLRGCIQGRLRDD